jgi:hypothetical protein
MFIQVMRKLFPLFIVSLSLFYACEDVQTNTASLQANLDEFFYKAEAAIAEKHQDNSYTITGYGGDQTFVLHIDSPQAGEYPVGGSSPNWATYTDSNGSVYTTIPSGEGAITVTSWDTSFKTLTGKFSLTMVLPGIDTLRVHQGLFFEVPYGFGATPNDTVIPENDGSFLGQVDGTTFTPTSVNGIGTGNNIVVSAVGATYTITLTFPIDVTTGNYQIPSTGITATITDGTNSEVANQGTAVIVEHDTGFNVLKGTFSFQTDSHVVSLGQFDITY